MKTARELLNLTKTENWSECDKILARVEKESLTDQLRIVRFFFQHRHHLGSYDRAINKIQKLLKKEGYNPAQVLYGVLDQRRRDG